MLEALVIRRWQEAYASWKRAWMLVARAAERLLTDKSIHEQRLEIRVQIPGKAE